MKVTLSCSGIGLAAQLDGGLLRFAVTQFVGVVHEDRGDPVDEFAGEFGVAREMHPAELLDRRESGRQTVCVVITAGTGEREAVLQGEEPVAARLLVLDGEADEVPRRLSVLPIHRDEGHAVAAVQFEREQRRTVPALNLKITLHDTPPRVSVNIRSLPCVN